MNMYSLIIPSIVAVLIFLGMMLLSQRIDKKESIRERMQRMAGPKAVEEDTEAAVNVLYSEQEPSDFAKFLEKILLLTGADTMAFRKKSQLLFYRAGVGSAEAPIYYLFYKRILWIVVLLIALWIVFLPTEGSLDKTFNIIIAGTLAVLALRGADMYLSNKREKRSKKLMRGFPDTVDLLLACVESGLALDGALARVCKELGRAYPEITQELNRTRLELTLISDRPQALINLAERTDLHIFRLLTTTLLQSERFGTSLAETLRVLCDDSRQTELMQAEEKAGRLPTLMTIPLILLLLPALFIIVLGPSVLTTLKNIHNVQENRDWR